MPNRILLNDTQIAGMGTALAGTGFDTVKEAREIARLEAGGGVLIDEAQFPANALARARENRSRSGAQMDLIIAAIAAILVNGGIKVNRITATGQVLVPNALNILSGAGTIASTLPAVESCDLQFLIVAKSNIVADHVVTRAGDDTIEGATTVTLTGSAWAKKTLVADATANAWILIPPA